MTHPGSGNATWQDYPSTATIIDAASLERIESSIDYNRIAPMGRLLANLNTSAIDPVRVIFVGSSTTAGTGASSASTCYAYKTGLSIQAAYPAVSGVEASIGNSLSGTLSTNAGIQPFNCGVGGTTSADYISTTLSNQIIASNALVVIHMIGSNDYALNVDPNTYKTNIQSKISTIRTSLPNCTHVLAHSYQRMDVSNPTYSWLQYRAALRSIAEATNDVKFMDLSDPFVQAGVPGTDPLDLIGTDNVHSNDRGHALLADIARAKMGIDGPPVPISSSNSNRTITRFTSDGPNGSDTANIIGRNTDASAGGTSKTWVGDANGLALTSNSVRRGSLAATWFGGFAEPAANIEFSAILVGIPTAVGMFFDIHRGGSAGATASDCYRIQILTDGGTSILKRISGTTTTLISTTTSTAGNRLALRYFNGSIEFRRNNVLVGSVFDTSISAAGFCGFASTSTAAGINLTGITIDVVQ